MVNFFSSIIKKLDISDEEYTHGLENINSIRNQIINAIYLTGAIIGSLAIYGIIMRTIYTGWKAYYFLQILIFVVSWLFYLLRKQISVMWKSIIFFSIFFFAATLLNYSDGIVSGSIQFIIVITLVTLLYGWRFGVISILLMLIVRSVIGWMYFKGVLTNKVDLNLFSVSAPAIITSIIGSLFASFIIVFAINKFYQWLILSLKTLSVKADELMLANKEMLIAKRKAEENDRLKSVFLANMSHEIRTPMNAIIGFSDLLDKHNLSEEKRKRYIKLIQERSFDLLRIIQDILDISKIEVGQMKLMETEIKLSNFLDEIYEYYKLRVERLPEKSEIELHCYQPEVLSDIVIVVDHQRLKQVLNNLIDNAIKFTQYGRIEFGVDKHINNELLFYVKDTGIGIKEDKQSIIFERFSQVDDSLGSRAYGGTGLGLSIVKGILDLMGGNIWLTAEVNAGTTFYFTLPLRTGIKNQFTIKTTEQIDMRNWKNKTVLIVEDNPANNEILNDLLVDTGIKVLNARSGKETLSIIKANANIDLVLMDIRLPDTDGLQLTRQIKTDEPELVVIAQTAYSGATDISNCIAAGCNDFISKPLNVDKLFVMMGQYLNKKK